MLFWSYGEITTGFHFASVAVVQPCLPHAFGTGANACGAEMWAFFRTFE